MIAQLKGNLARKTPESIIINVGGVGYEVFIPLSSYDRLPAENQNCRILVFEYIREDQHSLFGFMTDLERKTFTLLMSVNGIGPKLAMSALSSLAVADLNAAIVAGDVARLATITGIGKKTAERMVVELRDKLSASGMLSGIGGGKPGTRTSDAILALVSLGYKPAEAGRMASAAASGGGADLSVEEIVRRALRR